MDTGLAGKCVLVTGGSGGIGSACVRAFAAEGARVAVHYHRGRERAEAVAAELGGLPVVGADLTDEAQVDRLFAETRDALGRVDVCAAVAGVWPKDDEPVWQLSAGPVGVDAPREPHRHVPHRPRVPPRGGAQRPRQPRPRRLDRRPVRRRAATPTTRPRSPPIQVGLLLSLKNEIVRIAPSARVNAVAPGWTVSEMTRGKLEPADVERVTRTMALQKVAVADDIARAVVVLASDELSGHVTGELVTVAGGMEGRTLHP